MVDFGCGSGENSLLLARRGARVVGVDISESLIELARRRLAVNGLAGAAQFVVGSAHDLPLRSHSIDAVLGIAILHHLNLDAATLGGLPTTAGTPLRPEPPRSASTSH